MRAFCCMWHWHAAVAFMRAGAQDKKKGRGSGRLLCVLCTQGDGDEVRACVRAGLCSGHDRVLESASESWQR